MKTKILLCVYLVLLSCDNDYLITKNRIGNYILGEKFDEKFDKNMFDIKGDNDNLIKSIIVRDPKYKTKEGFGVGSSLISIKNGSKIPDITDISISKGKIEIGNLGKSVNFDNITFVDNNNDSIVDFVWIQKLVTYEN